jgi:hypothetical protein
MAFDLISNTVLRVTEHFYQIIAETEKRFKQ